MIEALRRARPTWTFTDAAAAQQRLSRIGIKSVADLTEALVGLNDRLEHAGLNTFSTDTISALQRHLIVQAPADESESKAPSPCSQARPSGVTEGTEPASISAASEASMQQASLIRVTTASWSEKAEGSPTDAATDGSLHAHAKEELDSHILPTDRDSLGMWISNDNGIYEIRSLHDGGLRDPAHGEDVNWTGLSYIQRLATGEVRSGVLKRAAEGSEWEWEAALRNGGDVHLRRKGLQMVSRYRPPKSDSWEVPRHADRPQAYAFYDSYSSSNAKGHRFVHVGSGDGGGQFPIIGLTAGWLPVRLLDVASPELLRQKRANMKIRFLGMFCDPFDAAPPQPIAKKIRTAAPRPFAGHPNGQVLLTGDGGLTVQLPSRNASFGGPAGKGFGKKPGRPGSRPFTFIGNPTAELEMSKSSPALFSPAQLVAASFGCNTAALHHNGLFCNRMRELPRRRVQQDRDWEVHPDRFQLGSSGMPRRPLVSILCLRWYDYWSDPNPCSDYNILNDGYFTDLFHGPHSMGKLLPGDYEVYTIFVRGTQDLKKLDPQHLRSMLKGRNAAAWYFLWPSMEATGFVREPEFFALCQRMERAALRSCWPHESTLYRQLCGKLWIPQMSLNPAHQVPATTRVHYAEFQRDARRAASRALKSLMHIRWTVWGKSSVPAESFKGVVKLGFSWCGSDVLPFQGLHSLVFNIRKLFEGEGCENTLCLVQEMVPGVVGEHRVLCIYNRATNSFHREILWMQNVKESAAQVRHNVSSPDVKDFQTASSVCIRPEEVTRQCFHGDRLAARNAEVIAMQLVDQWLRWFKTESPEPPQCTRLDFLVTHPGPGRAEVWTCEVGECGASLCSIEVHGRNQAAMNSIILRDAAGRFPQNIPPNIPRNNGMKS